MTFKLYHLHSLLSQFGSSIFLTFDFHIEVSVSGAFKLDHLQPVEPIWFWNFSNFWLSYPRGQFLYSPGRWESAILPTYRGLSAWGIQTGTFAACWANFVLKCFQLLTLILGVQCLWHSNYTNCSLLSQFGSEILELFEVDTWGSVPMAFRLNHLQPPGAIWY